MTLPLLYLLSGLCAYLLGGVNPAIVLSKLVYHQDIRTQGSKNPGFTNFKRVYGNRYAWFVLALDLSKTAILCCIFCPLFQNLGESWSLGAAYTGLFTMVGHVFPAWYGFQGGKGFLVGASTIFFIDWRAGLIVFVLWAILLAATKYVSLAVIVSAFCAPLVLLLLGGKSAAVYLLCAAGSLLMILRHHENIRRLLAGTESKFHLSSKKA